jgi:transposase
MSGDRSQPRYDIVASTRRIYAEAQKRAIVAEILAGASVSEVARRHNMHTSLLFRWRRDYAAPQPSPRPIQKPAHATTFVPVALDSSLPAHPVPVCSVGSAIEIELLGGRRLRVGPDVDAAALMRIVAALEAAK